MGGWVKRKKASKSVASALLASGLFTAKRS
jgi:hypothetical protein